MRESRKNLRRNGFVRPSTIARITCRQTYSQITCDGSQTDTMTADWANLRVFLALPEEGSLTAAARRHRASPPTVARRLKARAYELGTRPFNTRPDRDRPSTVWANSGESSGVSG